MAGFRQIPGAGYGSAYIDGLIAGGAVWDTSVSPLTMGFGNRWDAPMWVSYHGPSKTGSNGQPYVPYETNPPGSRWAVGSWFDPDFPPILNAVDELLKITNIKLSPAWENYGQNPRADNLILWQTTLPIESTSRVWVSADSPQEVFDRNLPSNVDQAWLYLHSGDGAWSYPNKGGMGYTMLLNMFGSALGLEQAYRGFPGVTSASDPGPLGLNQAPFTVMSGNWNYQGFGDPMGRWGSMKSYGAFDIAALQKIYGTNTTAAAGNDVYTLSSNNYYTNVWGGDSGSGWTCIWDSGGIDTISGGITFQNVKIDVRAATLADNDPNAGGFLSQHTDVAGGFTIANGVVIENAIGGNGNDTLIGNSAANRLSGGKGKDTLTGLGGRDSFVVNTKLDKSRDTITDFSVRDDTIWLDNSIFKKLGSKGSEKSPAKLKAAFFKIGTKATDKDDYVIYNKKTGVLSYDADGSGKGKAIDFAMLKKNLALKYDDFAVI
ncbi:M10 family metallopeptidase C-terminal domain-containing protein [Microvirga zambiensis]|uniref:M10 family metallopeptidase C-terminal domain-containing protein n=1 Tax=Microvirga zambiensis TaxID=1402137 RepID=UPI00191EFDC6|nr:M10 family metallopeptidase C-terminal domain-containing protein [Microvirga zambiensis]